MFNFVALNAFRVCCGVQNSPISLPFFSRLHIWHPPPSFPPFVLIRTPLKHQGAPPPWINLCLSWEGDTSREIGGEGGGVRAADHEVVDAFQLDGFIKDTRKDSPRGWFVSPVRAGTLLLTNPCGRSRSVDVESLFSSRAGASAARSSTQRCAFTRNKTIDALTVQGVAFPSRYHLPLESCTTLYHYSHISHKHHLNITCLQPQRNQSSVHLVKVLLE